ncbi:AbrB family transcriptional regulator [Marinomonas flavescens]|uniref:AbrB family transcriptional regulator n=1 Tax=Marinomonas flavescens TaxID=2529379 RepID=UPI0010552153|nr:AbrB family transcriptional regulator [Marinomonas flavescens]
MPTPTTKPNFTFDNSPKVWTFLILLILSFAISAFLEAFNLPAALLLGPMIAGIIVTVRGAGLMLPNPLFAMAQGTLGWMIAGHLPTNIYQEIAKEWPIFLLGTCSTIVASSLLGWLLSRTGLLPGTTAIWGSSPGAASVMTIMSESYGADMRLVAFMQYLRVACCAIAATVVASMFNVDTTVSVQWFALSSFSDFMITVVMSCMTVFIGAKLRLPGGPLLLSIAVGIFIKFSGVFSIVLPSWYLAISFGLLGWGIGFRFSPSVLRHALHVFPHVISAIIALIFINGCFAMLLVYFANIDPLTAFLATSPGGADSVAIIAASTNADVAFVMSMQIMRFLLVLIVGPMLARWLSVNKATKTTKQ